MRTSRWWGIVVVGMALTVVCATDVPLLGIYVVSSEAKPGWRRFDSASFPNLGYIANRADLVIARLKDVHVQDTLQRTTMVHSDGASESTEEWQPTLVIELFPEDARALGELTNTHIGERILYLLGNEPLLAPVIRTKIDEPLISITVPKGTNVDKIKAFLQKLCSEKR